MKKLFTLLFAFILLQSSYSLYAQNDTLLVQDFQMDPIDPPMDLFPDSPLSDSAWINWDEDGIADANARPQGWYQALAFESPDSIPPGDTMIVFASSSWLTGLDTGNSDWLITPAIYIADDLATVHWKSAPYQGPRYMDGYSVKVLTGDSNYDAAESVTTIFRAAEMTGILGNNSSLDPADFEFSDGYVHANSYTDTTYFIPADTAAGEDLHIGVLEPHSVSLADYAGQWIFIAFHHDSADDNLLEIDDILVLGTAGPINSTKDLAAEVRFITYPNPVQNYLNVMYRLNEPADARLELMAQNGAVVAVRPFRQGVSGEISEQFDLRNLAAGMYSVVLTIDNQRIVKNVVKK